MMTLSDIDNQMIELRRMREQIYTDSLKPQTVTKTETTQVISNIEIEGKIIQDDSFDINEILVERNSMFLCIPHKKLYLKDYQTGAVQEYEIILPKDEKDLKIEELMKEIERLKGDGNVN